MALPKDSISLGDIGAYIRETDMFKSMNDQMTAQRQYEIAAQKQMELMRYQPQRIYETSAHSPDWLMGTTSITTAPSPDAATILLREEKLKLAKELEAAKARIVEQEDIIAELVNLLASVKGATAEVAVAKVGETEIEVSEPIPIDIVTDSPTFEHGGKTWFHHTPVAGAECPINGDAEIHVMLRQDGGEYRGNHQLAKYYEWGKLGVEYGIDGGLEIVAYRVADE